MGILDHSRSSEKMSETQCTPPQSPTHSVRRMSHTLSHMSSTSDVLEVRGAFPCQSIPNTSGPVWRKPSSVTAVKSYHIEDALLWAQYGIGKGSSKKKSKPNLPVSTEMKVATEKGLGRQGCCRTFSYVSLLCLLMLFSGCIGALCYAFIEQYLQTPRAFLSDQLSTDVAAIERSEVDTQAQQLRGSMLQLAEEINSMREHISQFKKTYSDIIPKPQKGVLEELFPPEPDLACSGNLGSVLATPDTTTYTVPTQLSVLGLTVSLQLPHRPPSTAIKGLIQEVGDCWPFMGAQGRLVLALHRPSTLTSVSLSHIPSTMSPSADIDSAPKHFLLLAHRFEEDLDNGLLLGEFQYSKTGPWRQTFTLNPLAVKDTLFSVVEFRFLENYGHPNYTCVYRVHVHGQLS